MTVRELIVDIPPDFPPGKVRVTVAQSREVAAPAAAGEDLPWEERPWAEGKLRELIRFEPKTGEEIAQADWIGAWA